MPEQTYFAGMEEFIPRPKPTLSHNARRVLEVIQGYSKGAWGFCGCLQRTLARVLGRSVRWLASALAELRGLGLLNIRHRGPHASEYRLESQRVAELLQSFAPATSLYESGVKVAAPPRQQTLPDRITRVLQRAMGRIRAAKNPEAYRQSIIACEFRLMKADTVVMPKPAPAEIPRRAPGFANVDELFGHLARIGVV